MYLTFLGMIPDICWHFVVGSYTKIPEFFLYCNWHFVACIPGIFVTNWIRLSAWLDHSGSEALVLGTNNTCIQTLRELYRQSIVNFYNFYCISLYLHYLCSYYSVLCLVAITLFMFLLHCTVSCGYVSSQSFFLFSFFFF